MERSGGSSIVLKRDRESQTKINGWMVRLKPTVTLTFQMEGDFPTISNISGVAVHRLLWIDVQQVQLTLVQKQRSVRIATSCGVRVFAIPGSPTMELRGPAYRVLPVACNF